MTALDPLGTCHLVGCPGKGQHEPHGIGAPTTDRWNASQVEPPRPFAKVWRVERLEHNEWLGHTVEFADEQYARQALAAHRQSGAVLRLTWRWVSQWEEA